MPSARACFSNLSYNQYSMVNTSDHRCYDATYWYDGIAYKINVLEFSNDTLIRKRWTRNGYERIAIQDIDTILKYKAKYNRLKDIEDLNNIANNELETILAE